ncbi:carbohydrate ABC transporter permease [Psychromicrobium xiongbiense]|uniref:carbohydrate ABC transporter permease n=1 Tax=Psychromicrobium xiongbiense TaxID=3051184 RepID=UPI0025542FE4|nr:sugar ABC transporter permease [Psychromicrobium sp. YIM S02556]
MTTAHPVRGRALGPGQAGTGNARVSNSDRRRRRGTSGHGNIGWLFLTPSLIGVLIFIVVPLLWSLVLSVMNWQLGGAATFVGFDNYARLFQDEGFRTAALNTTVYVAAFVPAVVILSLAMAAWIAAQKRQKPIFRILYFLPFATPIVANMIVWKLMLTPGGLFSGLAGSGAPNFLGTGSWAMTSLIVVSVWQSLGYNMLILGAAIDAVPESQLEAAEIDGAGALTRFRAIVLPMISPSLFFVVIITTIHAFQVFAQAYVLTGGGPGEATMTVVMFIFQKAFTELDFGYASAAGWVLFFVIIIFTAIQGLVQRRNVNYDS